MVSAQELPRECVLIYGEIVPANRYLNGCREIWRTEGEGMSTKGTEMKACRRERDLDGATFVLDSPHDLINACNVCSTVLVDDTRAENLLSEGNVY